MTTTLTKKTNFGEQDRTEYSFGVTDKGRDVGAAVSVFEVDFVPVDDPSLASGYTMAPGHYFAMNGNGTRDTVNYGSGSSTSYFTSAADRAAAADRYLKAARSRAVKKFSA